MIRFAALLSFTAACSSDYKVSAQSEAEDGATEEETVEEPLGLDTGDAAEDPADPDQPIARCDVTPDKVRPISEGATWIGRESEDPNGLAITYQWTLAYRPDGSAVEIPSGSITEPDRAGFTTDLAGEYIGRLVVTNSDGVSSDPCEVTLEAEPAEALWVEMFWENGGDDMDLHLLSRGLGRRGWRRVADGETTDDCCHGNCTVSSRAATDWGVGRPIDDPVLDLDDISETGPENINIEMPADGEYKVIVVDYPGSVYDAGNPVTEYLS